MAFLTSEAGTRAEKVIGRIEHGVFSGVRVVMK